MVLIFGCDAYAKRRKRSRSALTCSVLSTAYTTDIYVNGIHDPYIIIKSNYGPPTSVTQKAQKSCLSRSLASPESKFLMLF